jgi:Concanavalin A-like lectin/glucanases superfamily
VLALLTAGLVVGGARPAAAAPAQPSCVEGAESEAQARAVAAACGQPVRVNSSLTEDSQVVALPDGTMRYEAAVAPQRVLRDGAWTPISTVLARQADGLVRPAATLADVAFSGGGSGPLVTWREGGSTFTLSWPLGALPAPRLAGATATYESVLAGVNLHVTATADGYTHAVEVLTRQAAADPAVRRLRYVTGGDTRVDLAGDGTLRLWDRAGQVVATSGVARMWDSSRDPRSGGEVLPEAVEPVEDGSLLAEPATAAEPGVSSRVAPVSVGVSGTEVTVVADPALLGSASATFPLFIDPPFEKQRAAWAYATSNGENNDASAARVGRQPSPDGSGERYRSYYQFAYGAMKGKKILSGTVRVRLDHSYSCGATWVYLYRTGALTVSNKGRMGWSTRPMVQSQLLDGWSGAANEAGGCGKVYPDVDAEFTSGTMRNHLQLGADSGWSMFPVGVCACDGSGNGESDVQRWKKFFVDKAWLEVVYNSVPAVPTNLTTAGQGCGATIGTQAPVLKAYLGDVDGANDSVTGHFEYQQTPSGSVVAKTSPAKPGNSYGEASVTNLGVLDGTTFQWRVKTRDRAGHESPSWSAWCAFTVDTQRPPRPGVSSTAYPADGVARGGPGVAGQFTFSAGAPDVVRYVYGWAGSPHPLTTVTVARGASYSAWLTPPRHGSNTLNVYSIDGANKQSDTHAYEFIVGSPSAPLAHWPLDSIDGHFLTDQIGNADLAVEQTDLVWEPNQWVVGEQTALLDGDRVDAPGVAKAAVPGLDTAGSFSVAAWVRTPSPQGCPASHNWTAVSMDGQHVSGFMLTYNCGAGRWRMRLPAIDEAQPVMPNAEASAPSQPGEWVHLVGVWDEAERRISLWVNGVLDGNLTPNDAWLASRGTGWRATGPVVIGRDRWNDSPGGRYSGGIRDVRVWNRVVTADDILGTAADPAEGRQETAGILAPTEVASWDFNGGTMSGCAPARSSGYWSQRLELRGCTDPPSADQTIGYTGDAHDDNDALWLNQPQPDGHGKAGLGNAATAGPVLRTDQSYTVSAWVRLGGEPGDALPTRHMTAVAHDGNVAGAFVLAYHNAGRWGFWLHGSDAANAPQVANVRSATAPVAGTWTHLVGVYDAGADKITLYVNGGASVTSAALSAPVTWSAPGPLVVGRELYNGQPTNAFSGDLDQVKVFAGAMSDRQVKALYTGS